MRAEEEETAIVNKHVRDVLNRIRNEIEGKRTFGEELNTEEI